MKKIILGIILATFSFTVSAELNNKEINNLIEKKVDSTGFLLEVVQKENGNIIEQIPSVEVYFNHLNGWDVAKSPKEGYVAFLVNSKKDENSNINVAYTYQNANGKNKPYYEKNGSFIINVKDFKSEEKKEVYYSKIKNTDLIIIARKK